MGEHVNLDRLGGHVSGSLEQVRTRGDAAARVRARLAAGEDRPRIRQVASGIRVRRGAVLGALALAASVLLCAFGVWRQSRAPLTFVVAGATRGAPGTNGVVGAFLAAPADAELPIAFSDGTHMSVAPGARARIAEVTPRGARVLVESGVVHASVVHRSDTHWLVDAGPFEVKVTGTRFDVAWQPGEQAIVVSLHEGSVVVTGCGLADGQRVSGGQQLRASCKTGAATLAPLAAGGTTEPSSATAALLAPAVAPPASGAPEPVATAASSLPDAPRERVEASPTSPATPTTPASAHGPAAGSPVAAALAVSPAAPTAAELLARANTDRYAGRFDAASESLDAVRRRFRGTDDAATAAFELGRIAFDGQHDFGAAGDWFDTYLRERPAGALAREALGRAIEARHRAGDATRAGQLATRYVALYPDGPHATLARRLAARAGATP